jgi:hypothetical protein
MKTIAFPVLVPRFKANGQRNTIDLTSATIGADIQAMLLASLPAKDRLYPFPKCEEVSFERTETVYETASSGQKYKLDGVGGIRTFMFQLWRKNAVHQMLRELKKVGCTEVDFFLVDVAGTLWGIKDSVNSTTMRGYEMSTETFDAFKDYATDTTVAKLMVSWDLDRIECEEMSFALTSEVLGYPATSLRGNVSGYSTLTELTNEVLEVKLNSGFGSATTLQPILGLVQANFELLVNGSPIAFVVAETGDGLYTLTHDDADINPTDIVLVNIVGVAGFDIESATIEATL